MQKSILKTIFIILFFFSTISSIYSYNVEVFTKYNTEIVVHKNDTLDVKKILNLRNVHDSGIIPGQIEFKILSDLDGNDAKITSYSAVDRYGRDIKSQISQTQEGTVILLDIFTPILPGFEHIINLDYTIEFDGSGIFFKTLEVPLKEETKIPVWGGEVKIEIPKGFHFTHLEDSFNYTKNGTSVTFEFDEKSPTKLSFEYSRIPLSIPYLQGSLVFWLIINIIIFTLLGLEIRKELQRRR